MKGKFHRVFIAKTFAYVPKFKRWEVSLWSVEANGSWCQALPGSYEQSSVPVPQIFAGHLLGAIAQWIPCVAWGTL